MSLSVQIFFFVINALAYLVAPVALVWGWLRWISRPKRQTVAAFLSLTGFILASGSALVAASSIIYAQLTNGFGFYDPRLMKIIALGFLLSLAGFVCGICGVWRPNALRWHSPACAMGMLAFWIGIAESQ